MRLETFQQCIKPSTVLLILFATSVRAQANEPSTANPLETCPCQIEQSEGEGDSAPEGDREYAALGPGITYHQQRTQAGRRYNWLNWGFGLEERGAFSLAPLWQQRVNASLNEDSFRHLSLFGAAEVLHDLYRTDVAVIRLGPATGLAYKYMRWSGPYRVVPLLGPVLAIDPISHGVAVELYYLYHRNETSHRVNGLITLRFVYRFGLTK